MTPAHGPPTGATAPDGRLLLTGSVQRGRFTVAVDLAVAAGEVVALLGPNGAGKSTLLRAVAGLERLRTGRLMLGGDVLDDAGTGAFVPARDRGVGTVFQDHRLFPHLTAEENVAFGPRARGLPRRRAEEHARLWLDRLGVGTLADRRPAALSGGQAQRVAVARALAAEPRALLLDEPMAALDAGARGEVQRALAAHLAPFAGPCLLVTHDVVDALVLADRVVVLDAGRVVQDDVPSELVRRPATPFVARLLGVNLLTGRLGGEAVLVAVAPGSVQLDVGAGPTSAGDGWPGEVATLTRWGDHVRVEVSATTDGTASVRSATAAAATAMIGVTAGTSTVVEVPAADIGPALRPGASVWLSVPGPVEVYPPRAGLTPPDLL